MGVVPPAGAISWLATSSRAVSQDNARGTSSEQAQVIMPSTGLVCMVSNVNSIGGSSVFGRTPRNVLDTRCSSGSYMGEGLLPIPERLTKKILQLEFVEMRERMPETWLRDEEESTRNTLSLPPRRTALVKDILQWL